MASNEYVIFRQAILNRHQVTCVYQGRSRALCPHVIGTKRGQEKVLSYQLGGGRFFMLRE